MSAFKAFFGGRVEVEAKSNQMEGFIKADTNRDKKATSADATPIINVVYGK